MSEIAAFILKDHPNWSAVVIVLWLQYFIAKQYPQTLRHLTIGFQVCVVICLIYITGYNSALSDLPYAANNCSFPLGNGEMTNLSAAIKSIKGDANLWFLLLLTSLGGQTLFPWLEQHRKEPRV